MISPNTLVEFEHWMAGPGGALAIPLSVVERKPDLITLRFIGLVAALAVVVTSNEIRVTVDHDSRNWDALVWFDCVPKVGRRGAYCRMCVGTDRQVFSTPKALLADHLFEPFAHWVSTKLLPVQRVGLGGSDNGTTWATLLAADDDQGYSITVSLRGVPQVNC